MTTYRVEKDGVVVYEHETDEYEKEGIPAEYRARPESGEVRLYVDDELIGVQIPLDVEEEETVKAQRALDLPEEGDGS